MTNLAIPYGIIDTVDHDNVMVVLSPLYVNDENLPTRNVVFQATNHTGRATAQARGYVTEVSDTVASILITERNIDQDWPNNHRNPFDGQIVYLDTNPTPAPAAPTVVVNSADIC